MEHVVSISPSGQVKAMHNDCFPMGFLGQQSIGRASDITWNDMEQHWRIEFNVDGKFVGGIKAYEGFDSYDAARSFEVAVMNESMKRQLQPTAVEVIEWAMQQRL